MNQGFNMNQRFNLDFMIQGKYCIPLDNGPVAQLVRASPCHGEGRRFESDLGRFLGS